VPAWLRRRPGPGVTAARLRELVDGLERACASGDRAALRACTTGPARVRLLEHLDRIESVGAAWEPARAELCWARGSGPTEPGGMGVGGPTVWLRLRFRDRSRLQAGRRRLRADDRLHHLRALVEIGPGPWRLVRLVVDGDGDL